MKNLIVIAHPDQNSFCYNGIYKTILQELDVEGQETRVADLYSDDFERPRGAIMDGYKADIIWADRIYFISPVWWFRLTPRMEVFFDEVLTPGFAYKFVTIIGKYAYPKPFLKDKRVRTYITHGAPSLPVITLYLNSVKLRLVMGVYTFVFGWSPSRWLKTKQFWSVPFVSDEKRKSYLKRVAKDIRKDIKKDI